MKYEFTGAASEALNEARAFSKKSGRGLVETSHILCGLFTAGTGIAYKILEKAGVDEKTLRSVAEETHDNATELLNSGDNEFTGKSREVLDNAGKEAYALRSLKCGTEHILLALIKTDGSTAISIFSRLKIDIKKVYLDILVSCGINPESAEKDYSSFVQLRNKKAKGKLPMPALMQYSRNLNAEAERGNLDPVIGRDIETNRVMQILCRRMKNNACLVGEPGVGKTAIVEGLAQLIESGNVPENLRDKKILSLDLSGMVAGSKYRGEFEDRIKKTINEVKAAGNVILFIDELHTLVGAGNAEGSMDASNILKPSLSRGEIQVIGATTREEYRKYIEKDAALERRFQPVSVEEPTPEETLLILKGIKHKYEEHHGTVYSEEALKAAIDYSVRYINDRFLPDKAIDLIDEAGARKNLGFITDISVIHNQKDKIKELEELLEKCIIEDRIGDAGSIKKRLDRAKKKYQEMLRGNKDESSVNLITEDDIADVISIWTKIPVSKITESETKKLIKLEDKLHERVIGQDEAVKAVATAIRRGRVGLKSPGRPIGSFLFLGPTGVGKTELSKALAETLFGDENSIIRVDMSEYMEKYSVSRLIGSPPGYVGFEDGGQLSEKVRKNPYSVILFDEVEKAHPDVLNVLLQVLDDGIITDAHGRRVSFKNTIIIMTSNAGAERIIDSKHIGFISDDSAEREHDEMKSNVMEEIKSFFRPEFINRIDEVIVFRALTKDDVMKIADLMLKDLKKRAKENLGVTLMYGDKLRKFIHEKGYDPKYGARPLRRAIQTHIEDALSLYMLENEFEEGDRISISVNADKVIFKKNIN